MAGCKILKFSTNQIGLEVATPEFSEIIDTFVVRIYCFIIIALCYYRFANQTLYLAVGKHPLDLVSWVLTGRLVLDAFLVLHLQIAVGE